MKTHAFLTQAYMASKIDLYSRDGFFGPPYLFIYLFKKKIFFVENISHYCSSPSSTIRWEEKRNF